MNIIPDEFKVVHNQGEDKLDVYVLKNGAVVYDWYDGANVDFPEDLTWNRDISEVFWSAFKLGYDHAVESIDIPKLK